MIAVATAQRTHEGLRLALGAAPRDVRWMVVRGAVGLAGAGVAIGLLASIPVSARWRALTGDVLRVRHLRSALRGQVGVSYEVVVPANTRVRAQTGSGDVWTEGVAGPVTAKTGSGGTRVSDVGGEATVEAGSGSVEILAVGGDVDVRTGSGAIRIERFEAALRARTGSSPAKGIARTAFPDTALGRW